MHGLSGIRVVDFSTGIAGPYCTKLFVDAGAEVVLVEPRGAAALRTPLFRFLHASKRSVTGAPGDAHVAELIAGAELVVEAFGVGAPLDRAALLARDPGLVLCSISPFGLTGPYANRPATEFTIQAECGSISVRGRPGQEPYQAGGRVTEWFGGVMAAVGAGAAVRRARASGHGEHVDVSLQEAMALATTTYADLSWSLMGRGKPPFAGQSVETPSIEPSADGFVGFNTNTAQQFSDFLLMIERPELRETGEFNTVAQRLARLPEWEAIVHAWTRRHTTAEIIERAALLRIPVSPVCNGETVLAHEQLRARAIYREDPSGGFQRPCPPYKLNGARPPEPSAAPRPGEHDGRLAPRARRDAAPRGARALPLAGLRVVDATTWWAGPTAGHLLATLGADTIHLESIQKMDGGRAVGFIFANGRESPWEFSTFSLSANTNKRGLTLNLGDARGREALRRLIARADVVLENFSPRVMESFGVDWEFVRAANPRAIYVRMPAFGLDGPWRERVGFAQTMEQMSGLAWVTGRAEDQPRIQRGPCDPLAGAHAAFATLVALAEREATGRGVFVESAMIESALNAAAEQVIAWTARGELQQRDGNRSPLAAPQGLYPCAGHDALTTPRWLALSVETDAQWRALLGVTESATWTPSSRDAALAARRAAQDAIDAALRPWFAARELEDCVARLVAAGVPAAAVQDARFLSDHAQFTARGFCERIAHPVVGDPPLMTVPFRYASVARWLRRAAPTLGQHNHELLAELGYGAGEIAAFEAGKLIGTRPIGL
ncbi:MAG TPA: CoA transferase [Myxococcota bacterium]|jgi:crotonobetainyl-CoA:carnitine CoA-transferase CaiB-like acyl-CoA transferase